MVGQAGVRLQELLANCIEAPGIRDADCSTRCNRCELLQDLSEATWEATANRSGYRCFNCGTAILWIEASLNDASDRGHPLGDHVVANPSDLTIEAGGFAPILLPASPVAMEAPRA